MPAVMVYGTADLDELIDAITVDCYGEDEQQLSFLTAMEDTLSAPVAVSVVGVALELVAVDQEATHGLVAVCRREDKQHLVSLLDVEVSEESTFGRIVAAYRRVRYWTSCCASSRTCATPRRPSPGGISARSPTRRSPRSSFGASRRFRCRSCPHGRVRCAWGYVEPTEAAWEILEEAVEPWLEDISRLAGLGLDEAARATGAGVLGGLYRCRDDDDGDRLLSWAIDFPGEQAWATLAALDRAGIELHAREPETLVPEWADRLSRRSAGA